MAFSRSSPQFSVHSVYFTASGTTQKITQAFCHMLGGSQTTRNVLKKPLQKSLVYAPTDVLIVGAPVYSGRVAPPALESFRFLKGTKTPAVLLITYGNRAYDDTILELKDLLEEQGFLIVAAGAFVAQHAVFPRYAKGRPDEKDMKALQLLADQTTALLQGWTLSTHHPLHVPGKRPYRTPIDFSLPPRVLDTCISCGTCAAICPAKVIAPDAPQKKPAKGCHSCSACIHACPKNARYFGGPLYTFFDTLFWAVLRMFLFWRINKRTEPELFIHCDPDPLQGS